MNIELLQNEMERLISELGIQNPPPRPPKPSNALEQIIYEINEEQFLQSKINELKEQKIDMQNTKRAEPIKHRHYTKADIWLYKKLESEIDRIYDRVNKHISISLSAHNKQKLDDSIRQEMKEICAHTAKMCEEIIKDNLIRTRARCTAYTAFRRKLANKIAKE